MPTFLSTKGRQTLEFARGYTGRVKDPVLGIEEDIVVKPLKVQFAELQAPFPVRGLPGKKSEDGVARARGILTPGEAVRQLRSRSRELGASCPFNLPKDDEQLAEWFVQKMRSHRMNGSLFIEVSDAAEAAPEPLENIAQGVTPGTAEIVPQEASEAPLEAVQGEFQISGGVAYCLVCDKTLDARGKMGHSRSKEHKKNREARDAELRQASGF